MTDWCCLRIRQGAKGLQSPQLRAFSLALLRFSWHPPVPLTHLHITDRRRVAQVRSPVLGVNLGSGISSLRRSALASPAPAPSTLTRFPQLLFLGVPRRPR